MDLLKVNGKLLPPKLHYFTYFAGVAALWSFTQVCGRQLGISEFDVGIIFTVAPILGIICNPLFGAIADHYRIKKKLFLICIALNAASLLGFALLPYDQAVGTEDNEALLHACEQRQEISSQSNATTMYQNLTAESQEAAVLGQNRTLLTDGKLLADQYEAGISFDSPIFWLFTILVLSGWISMAVVTSIADALCFQTLGEKHHLYGMQRQWGAIGWGGATLLAGYLIDVTSKENEPKNYTPCFYLVGAFMLANFIVSCLWKVEEEEKSKSKTKDLTKLITEPRIFVFILACITVGVCTGLQWNFLYWYVEDLTKSTESATAECEYTKWLKLIQGAIAAVQCFAGEVPFFYLSGWFIKKFGHVNCMSLVMGAFGLRFLLYSLVTNPWMILPIELFQGLTYGIFYSTMASYAFIISPPGTGATVQSFVAASFEGIGVSIGSFLAGACFKVFDGRTAFRLFGFTSLGACVLHVLSMYCINRSSKLHNYQQPGHGSFTVVDDDKGKSLEADTKDTVLSSSLSC